MKKILLTIIILLNIVYANGNTIEKKIFKIGTKKYSSLDNNLKTFYLSVQKERRKDLLLVDYTKLDLQDNRIPKDGNIFNISYVFKLAYENELIFGPKISYVIYDFDNYKDDYIKTGVYISYDIDNNFRLYSDIVLNDTIKKRKERNLNNINFGFDYSNKNIVYSINIETSASINFNDTRLHSSDEYDNILFSLGFKY